MLLAPCVRAQSWGDMQSDRSAIAVGRARLRHDRHELHEDLERGDYGAAAHEQAEINRRRAAVRERQEDLNNDVETRYNGWSRFHDEDDE
jgi:hypothetical protein